MKPLLLIPVCIGLTACFDTLSESELNTKLAEPKKFGEVTELQFSAPVRGHDSKTLTYKKVCIEGIPYWLSLSHHSWIIGGHIPNGKCEK